MIEKMDVWAVDGYGFWSAVLSMGLTLASGPSAVGRTRGVGQAQGSGCWSSLALCPGHFIRLSTLSFLTCGMGCDSDSCFVSLMLQGLNV